MGFFNLLTQQLGTLLNSQSAARKLMVFLIMGASIAALGYMFMHAQNGSFKTLAKNLQPEDQFDVASRLRTMGIRVRFAQDGAELQVPDSKWDQALMVLSQDGLPASGISGYELLDKSSIGMSSEEQKIRYHRALER